MAKSHGKNFRRALLTSLRNMISEPRVWITHDVQFRTKSESTKQRVFTTREPQYGSDLNRRRFNRKLSLEPEDSKAVNDKRERSAMKFRKLETGCSVRRRVIRIRKLRRRKKSLPPSSRLDRRSRRLIIMLNLLFSEEVLYPLIGAVVSPHLKLLA